MRYIAQSFRFGFYNYPLRQRMAAIKQAGFDGVMLWWGSEYSETDSTPFEQFDIAQSLGLRVDTVHFPTAKTNNLWDAGDKGRHLEDHIAKALAEAGERGIQNLVVHTNKGRTPPPPSAVGVQRLQRLLAVAQQYQINIALENTRFLAHNALVYQQLTSPRLGFCFDSGHAHAFTPTQDPLGLFSAHLTTVHLHDNVGHDGIDRHWMMGEGNIDFLPIIQRLKATGLTLFNLESRYSSRDERDRMDMSQFLELSFQRIRQLLDTP